MADNLTTAADVEAAEQDAAQRAEAVQGLLARVRNGDDTVTPEEVHLARQAAEFAELRVDHVRNMFKQAEKARHLTACQQLRDEADQAGDNPELADLFRAFKDAALAAALAFHARNQQIAQWRQRMQELGVPEHRSPFVPHEDHAGLGYTADGTVIAGRRRFEQLTPGRWFLEALMEAQRELRSRDNAARLEITTYTGVFVPSPAEPDRNALDDLAKLAAPREPEIPKYVYRGSNGAILPRDTPFTPDEMRTNNITLITHEEAYR